MPPCIVDRNNAEGRRVSTALQLSNLKKAVPEQAFNKVMWKSFCYMFFDYFMWFGSFSLFYFFSNSQLWNESLPLWLKLLSTVLYWNFAGFFMWTIFIIGHDCGHTTFSDYELVNDFIGHVTHGSILVPYYPWRLSHRRHHMYHNHEKKDYSHPWYTPDRLAQPDEGLARLLHNSVLMRALFPIFGWHIYLYGKPDGCHYFPFADQRLWKDTPYEEKRNCLISTAVVIAYAVGIFFFFEQNLSSILYYYGVPYFIFGWWLVAVTYLQHHNPDTVVYEDKDWTFVESAFETVDRTFGYGFDTLHHHITDGHVAHHLFFTKIPHYHLPMATKAIKKYMEDNDVGWMYKSDQTYDFPYRLHKYFIQIGLKAKYAPSSGPKSVPTEATLTKKII